MKLYSIIIVLTFLRQVCFSQFDSSNQDEIVFTGGCLEIPAKYPGGPESMIKLFTDSMNYPELSEKQGIGGRVIIQFIVDTYGNTTEIKVYEGVCDNLNQEAMRLISLLKGWKPATQNGTCIRSVKRQPFIFVIADAKLLTKNCD